MLEYHNREKIASDGSIYDRVLDYVCVPKPVKCDCGATDFELKKSLISIRAYWSCTCGKEWRIEGEV